MKQGALSAHLRREAADAVRVGARSGPDARRCSTITVNVSAVLDQYPRSDGERFPFRLPLELAGDSVIEVLMHRPSALPKSSSP